LGYPRSVVLAFLLLAGQDDFLREVQAGLPHQGRMLVPAGASSLLVTGGPDIVTKEGALKVSVSRAGATAYEAQVQSPPTTIDVKKDDTIYLCFEVRSLSGGRESGEASWALFVQRPVEPWDNTGMASGSIGRQWRRLHYAWKAVKDFPAGELSFAFHVSQQPQVLEFRNFAAFNLGPTVPLAAIPVNRVTYSGQEKNAPWRARAEKMIDQHRKANLTVSVQQGGKAVRGAKVSVKHLKHEYPFGTFLDRNPKLSDEDAAQYRAQIPRLFNRVTIPIYWADWGWESEQERKGYFDRIAWAKENGLRMKAHTLVWPSMKWSPSRLRPLLQDPLKLRQTIVSEARQRVEILSKEPVENIDVLNELRSEREFGDIVGTSMYKELFDLSRAAWPKADLVYNDYDIFEGGGHNVGSREAVKSIIRRLQADKTPLTMLGWQGHFGESLTPPETVWKLLDEFAEFKLPIEITEFDVESRDEQSQADYTRDLLTAWFAHPRTSGFTMWGIHEKYHWKPLGAMFRSDWSPKPNLAEWVRLTQKVWTTNASATTSPQGSAAVRGFKGDYLITVEHGGKKVTKKAKLAGKSSRVVVSL
jgi:endo-1,4-beta-xylanase